MLAPASSAHTISIFGFGNRAMVILSMCLFCVLSLSITTAQLTTFSTSEARGLDGLLQNYAYQAFLHPKTGVIYDGVVSSNLTGVQISALRLRNGSLRKKGFRMYKEFQIPKGIIVEHPYVKRLVLVHHNLGNWSTTYYPLENYTYLAPVLGLLAYSGSSLTAKNLPELSIHASDQPISIQFPELRLRPYGTVPKCVSFDTNGSVNFSDVLSDNICTTFQQGHFSIVVESIAHPFPATNATKRGPMQGGRQPEKDNSKAGVIIGSLLAASIASAVLGFFVVRVSKYYYRRKMDSMERAADIGEALNMFSVGGTKAPAATGTRTHPKLETEFMP